MANPLGCAAANASLDLFEREDRLEAAHAIGQQLNTELAPLQSLPNVVDVRVMGAIGVVQLKSIENPAALRTEFLRHGTWIRPFRDIVYLTPALTISPDELSHLTAAIGAVLKG
jgi:adenosylmethionine-8-amino-7-oxononanoate aminotransferase